MDNKVKLVIELPGKILTTAEVSRVVIPAKKGDITILSERAPSVFVTDFGMVQLLDYNDKVIGRYFTAAGAADVAEAKVRLMVPMAVSFDEISLDEAKEKTANEADEQFRVFYQMIVDKLEKRNFKYISQ